MEVHSGLARLDTQGNLADTPGDFANCTECPGVCFDSGFVFLGSGLFSVVDNATADRLRGLVRGS